MFGNQHSNGFYG